MKSLLIPLGLLLLLNSCYPPYTQVGSNNQINYNFSLQVVNDSGQPLSNVKVWYEISKEKNTRFSKFSYTNNEGIVEFKTEASKFGIFLNYKLDKDGYCPVVDKSFKDYKSENNITRVIVLYQEKTENIDFDISIIGLDEKPIENVFVGYNLSNGGEMLTNGEGYTSNQGKYVVSIPTTCLNDSFYVLRLILSKEYYYSVDKTFGFRKNDTLNETITLISKLDYFSRLFIKNNNFSGLRNYIVGFIDLLVLKSLLSDAVLQYYSVALREFKENKYLSFKFKSTNTYNSIKLNKYDIGKHIFDETIRKILKPLNDFLGESNAFYGYELIVNTSTKNFIEENAVPQEIEYRFYIPKDVVKSYKNLDITGQQVLDSSIILRDGERIELKLQ